MATQTHNFDILIGPRNEQGAYAVRVIDSPQGQSQNPVYQVLPQNGLQELLSYAQNLVAELNDMKELGDSLFQFLFPQDVKALFDQCQPAEGALLRVRLRWDSLAVMADLGRLPWEYAFDGRDFLAQRRPLSLTRFLHDKAPAPLQVPETLRILAVSAAPSNMPPLELETELQYLQEAVAEHTKIELKMLTQATRQTLRQAVVTFEPHVLHFAGHGQRQDETGGLVLCDGAGAADFVPAEDLRRLLDRGSVRLAILNGCETAAQPRDKTAAVQSVAAQLVGAGLPAVIGMQYALPDAIALTFMREIYRGIVANKPLDQTMTEARIALYFDHDDKNYWALPALYLRVHDGHLFGEEKDAITKIVDLIEDNPELIGTVGHFKEEIKEVHRNIAVIGFYKQLHDDLQTMETSHAMLSNDFQRLPQDTAAWDDLMLNEFELQDVLAQMLANVQKPGIEVELGQWHTLLERGGSAVQKGIEQQDMQELDKGLRYLLRALQKGLPSVNKSLVIYAGQLRLAKLTESLRPVQMEAAALPTIHPQDVADIAGGLGELEGMAAELKRQVSGHNHWQDFDDDLRRVESSLNGDLFELELSWPDLQERATQLFAQEQEQWATSLVKLGGLLERSMTSKPVPTVIGMFKKYRQQAVRRFRKVDHKLLTLCQQLKEIGGPVDALLRLINE